MSNLWINKFETKGVEYDIHASNEDELQKKLVAGDNIEIDPDTNEISSVVPIATDEDPGIVKPDGTTITVDDDGTIHAVNSGSSATTYNQLSGKPSINGVEISGNKSGSIYGLADKSTLDSHIEDDSIHVTEEDKDNWNAKADQSIVEGIATTVSNHTNNSNIHVTAQDKYNWNNKAEASDVSAIASDLEDHVDNNDIHVTFEDKDNWNAKSDFSGDYNDLDNKPTIPTQLSQLSSDTTHRLVTDTEKNAWDNKSDFSGSYNDLDDKPDIPESLADLSGDTTHRVVTDAEKASWNAKSDFSGSYNDLSNKPSIPDELSDLSTDEDHRLVTDSEKALWNAKSDFSGDYDDLSNKPTIPTQLSQLTGDSTHRVITDSERTAWNAKQNALPTAVVDKYLHVNALTGQLEWSDSNGGSVVEWNQLVSEGTKIAQLTIDGVPTDIYAPTSGGGSSTTSLGQLDDVALSGLSDGQLFSYNNTTHKWQNKTFDSVVANPVVSGLETELEAIKISGTKYIIPKGSEVEFEKIVESGTKIATITIDGSFYDIYVPDIPTSLSDLTSDSTHRVVTDAEKSLWNAKSDFSGSYNDLSDKPDIPDELSDLASDASHRTVTDTEKSAWNAKASTDTATTSSDGLMSSEDKSKLDSIEDDAQANVLEGVKINGTDLDISNKKVNVPIATTSNLGVVKPDGTTTTVDENGVIHSVGGGSTSHPYTSLERYRSYSFRITFDKLPERVVEGSNDISGCSSFVSGGKVYRNLDWNYNNGCAFNVITKDFKGMAHSDTLTDGNFTDEELGQLPYQIIDGRNDDGIIVTTHVVHNDWEWTGSGDTETGLVPYLILTNVHDINDLSTYINSIKDSLKVPERLIDLSYVHQFLISDGTITYALLPPTTSSGSYSLANISTVPKLSNFRWINKATISSRSDSDLQLHPNGIERWNLMPCNTKDIRYTKAYESTAWLSEFIGENETTKNSTDEELEAIYDIAHEAYLNRTREDEIPTWQTMYSVVYSVGGIEELYFQEDFGTNYAINNIWRNGLGVASAQTSGTECNAFGDYSVAEGSGAKSYGEGSHSEGIGTVAEGIASHAEGQQTQTIGDISHAEGGATIAGGDFSHAEGNSTVTNNPYEHAEGHFNNSHIASETYGNSGNTIHSVGIGNSLQNKKNAVEIMQNGDEYLYGVGNYDGSDISTATTLQDIINSKADSSDIPTSLSELSDDSTHRVVTDTEKNTWNSKQDALPTVVNNKYLHTNSSTGALEWSDVTSGDTISWTQLTTSGTKIAQLVINGTPTDVYAPTSGGGGVTSLGQLDDVVLSSLANNDNLVYDSSTSKWKNKVFDNVVANPTVVGTESDLTSLQISGIKYAIPQGSVVEFSGVIQSGTKIATITIDDTPYDIYIPEYYTKSEIDDALSGKADSDDIPTQLSQLSDDTTHRLVTDTDKSTWNSKAGTSVATSSANGLMSSTDKSKLDDIAANAQVNVLEGVQLNGSDLSISDKKVNIPKATSNSLGVVKPDGTTTTIDNNGVIHAVGGGGGESVWGAIGGTLSDQTDLQDALDDKVDKITGKGLSTNDYTNADKAKVDDAISEVKTINGQSIEGSGNLNTDCGSQATVSGSTLSFTNGNALIDDSEASLTTTYSSSKIEATKSDKISIVTTSSSSYSSALDPDKFYNLGELSSFYLSINTATDSTTLHEYMFQFNSGNTPTVFTYDEDNIIIANTNFSTEANKTYQGSIVNGICAIIGV